MTNTNSNPDALEILEELLQEEEKKGMREVELIPQIERDLVTLRGVVEKLLPIELQEWINQLDEVEDYWDVPLPPLEEVYNSNWESYQVSFAPTRRFEGEVGNGVKIWVELSYSTLVVKVNGAYIFGYALR